MSSRKRKPSRRKAAKEKNSLDDHAEELSDTNMAGFDESSSTSCNEENMSNTVAPDQTPITAPVLASTTTVNNENDVFVNVVHDPKSSNESSVWKHATKNEDGTASCRICGLVVKRTNGSTTGLRKHLLQVHKIQERTSKKNGNKSAKFSPSLRKELHTLVIEAIVKDGRSFDDFRRPGVMRIFQRIVPGKYLSEILFIAWCRELFIEYFCIKSNHATEAVKIYTSIEYGSSISFVDDDK